MDFRERDKIGHIGLMTGLLIGQEFKDGQDAGR